MVARQIRVSTKTWNVDKNKGKIYSIKSPAETCEQFKKEMPQVQEVVKPKSDKFSILEKVKSMDVKDLTKATGNKLNLIKENMVMSAQEKMKQMQPKETFALMRTQNLKTNIKLISDKICNLLTSIKWSDVPGKVKHGALVSARFSKDCWVVSNYYFRVFINSQEYEIMKEQTIRISILTYNFTKRQFKKAVSFVKEAYLEKQKK